MLLSLAVLAGSLPAGYHGHFPPGWNGEAATPPMAWRSWNAFLADIDDQIIRQSIQALIAKTNAGLDNKPEATGPSLWDAGYRSIGIDEGWEGCGLGVHGTQHDALGNPMVNTEKFPNMAQLVQYGHSRKVKMGFYQNGCACGEKTEHLINYEGDVRALVSDGFDSVKLDGCGKQTNMSLYAELQQNSGKTFETENCHWGVVTGTDDDPSNNIGVGMDRSSAPTREWCPFNLFRTSGDIRQTWASVHRNLQTALPYLDSDAPISQPHCWAYPDMLQVGNLPTMGQNRAHFGAWCVISAPLYLGFDLRNRSLVNAMMPIIGNTEAIAVNQQYAGHPGMLVKSWTPSTPAIAHYYVTTGSLGHTADQATCGKGWQIDQSTGHIRTPSPSGTFGSSLACLAYLDDKDREENTDDGDSLLVARKCDNSDKTQLWKYENQRIIAADNRSIAVDAWYQGAEVCLGACKGLPGNIAADRSENGGTALIFNANKGTLVTNSARGTLPNDVCLDISPTAGGGEALQLWAKPQPNGAVAVHLINNHQSHTYTNVEVTLEEVGLKQLRASARDIWARKDLPMVKDGVLQLTVHPRDSAFVLLTQVSAGETLHTIK